MTNTDTPQELERNPKPASHEHAGHEFCIECITNDLLRRDYRFEVALIAAIDLRALAKLRAARDRTPSWVDRWHGVLDPARLQADLQGNDVELRAAAEKARRSVGDYLVYRRHAPHLIAIEARIDERIVEIENEGNGTESLGHWHIN